MAARLQCGAAGERLKRLEGAHTVAVMTRTSASAATGRPNRVLIILAAAWMAVALAIGGTAAEVPSADQAPARAAAQPADSR
jgi:hypothetical protein